MQNTQLSSIFSIYSSDDLNKLQNEIIETTNILKITSLGQGYYQLSPTDNSNQAGVLKIVDINTIQKAFLRRDMETIKKTMDETAIKQVDDAKLEEILIQAGIRKPREFKCIPNQSIEKAKEILKKSPGYFFIKEVSEKEFEITICIASKIGSKEYFGNMVGSFFYFKEKNHYQADDKTYASLVDMLQGLVLDQPGAICPAKEEWVEITSTMINISLAHEQFSPIVPLLNADSVRNQLNNPGDFFIRESNEPHNESAFNYTFEILCANDKIWKLALKIKKQSKSFLLGKIEFNLSDDKDQVRQMWMDHVLSRLKKKGVTALNRIEVNSGKQEI